MPSSRTPFPILFVISDSLSLSLSLLASVSDKDFYKRSLTAVQESMDQPLIPGLPDDLAVICLAKLSHGYHGLLETVSKGWRDMIRSSEFSNFKARKGLSGDWLFALTERSNNQWIAYDPDANKWHPLPLIPGEYSHCCHHGFSSVSVANKFLIIGGSYTSNDPALSQQRPLITNDVLQFDPFAKQWTKVATMRTPRSHFAFCVLFGKVYVAGGRSDSCLNGLVLAEVYDPMTNKWEDLAPMLTPEMDCLGMSHKGKLHVLSDNTGPLNQKTCQVFDPTNSTWFIVDDIWPISRVMHLAIQSMGDDVLYIMVDWGESSVMMRDGEGDWKHVGPIPPVVLADHSRPLQSFGYGFAALRGELYILGGCVLKWEELGRGKFEIVKLDLIRVCDPGVWPLRWRVTTPMCDWAQGAVLGCASLEEESM